MEDNSSAQETASGTETQTQEAPVMIPKQRFDEVIAQRTSAQKMAEEAQAAAAAAMAQVATLTEIVKAKTIEQAPIEPAPDIDPEERKRFEWMARQVAAPLHDTVEQLKKTLQATQAELYAQRQQAEVASFPDLPAEVKAKAREFMKQYNVAESVALRLAAGDAAIDYAKRSAQGKASKAQFNGSVTLPFQGGAPPPTAIRADAQQELPATFYSLPWKEQKKLLEARGVHSKPL